MQTTDATSNSSRATVEPTAGTTTPAATSWPAALTLGFGTAVAMWTLGFAGRLPGVGLAPAALGVAFLALLLAGGFVAGRLGSVGLGARTGAVTAVLNFLIIGSVVKDRALLGRAAVGSLLAGAALGALGAFAGARLRGAQAPAPIAWPAWFARVAAAATLSLICVGGLVTSHDAGLAVPDWPNTYGSNMFLFPLERMTGGIYYEHSHRLFGSLVGLTTMTLLGLVLAAEKGRGWVRGLAGGAFALVVVQGVLGGMRVTGKPTLSMEAADLAPSQALAVVHGVTAQLFLALLVTLAAALSATWTAGPKAAARPAAGTDLSLGAWTLGLVLLQLLLGALVRHHFVEPTWHVVLAVAVVAVGCFAGVRAWGLHGDLPVLPRVGLALAGLLGLQLALGIGALVVTTMDRAPGARVPFEVPIATAHQTTGALILGAATLLFLWQRRLLTAPETPPTA